MANRICRAMFEVQDTQVAKMQVQASETFYPGQVVKLETLDTAITDNLEVYSPTPVSDTTADLLCILVNQGYETLSDGRRPSGNPDVSTYDWANEDTLTAIRLEKNMKFFISDDCLDNTGVVPPATGVYLVPQTMDYDLATSASLGTAATGLVTENYTTEPIGGFQFVEGSVTRVVAGY